MSTVQDIYNELFSGETVSVRLKSREEFETLRTSLCKKNQLQVALELTDGSICAIYDAEKQVGTFSLGTSKRAAAANRWEIIR
jgi:hypothetical protein